MLAGGHLLLPLMKLRLAAPSLLVDLRRVPGLSGIERENGDWRIGAMTTHYAVTEAGLGLASEAAGLIADPQVRYRGTIGGSLAHGDPASDLPAILLAAEGSVTVRGESGEREVAAHDLFQDFLTTAVADREILTGAVAGARRLRVRLREVQPSQGGLGDGGRGARWPRRRPRRLCEDVRSGSRTWARRRCARPPQSRRCAAAGSTPASRRPPSRPPRAPSRRPT